MLLTTHVLAEVRGAKRWGKKNIEPIILSYTCALRRSGDTLRWICGEIHCQSSDVRFIFKKIVEEVYGITALDRNCTYSLQKLTP